MVEISPLIARRSRISASAFTGRSDPTVTEIDPQSKALLNSNSIQLGLVSRQVENLSARVNQLSSSLQAVRNNLATSQALERQKENQEQILATKLAQQKLREGKESVIEKKITVAAFKPINKLGRKAQSSLSGLSSIFTRLFGAFLAFKGVETIKALAEGNTEKLEEIKNQVLLTVGGFVGLSLAVKLATGGLSLGFFKVGALLAVLGGVAFFKDDLMQSFRDSLQYEGDNQKNGQGGPENPDPKIDYQNQNQDPAIEPQKSPTSEVKPSSEPEAPNIDWWRNIITDSTPTSMKKREEKTPPLTKSEPTETMMGDKNKTQPQVETPDKGPIPLEVVPVEPSEVEPTPGLSAEELKQYNRAYSNKNNFFAKGQIKSAWNKMTPEQKASFLAYAKKQGHDWSDYGFTTPAQSEPKSQSTPQSPLLSNSREQEFRKETAKRENEGLQVGDKVTDPEILKMIEEEKEIGRTGKMPTNIKPIFNKDNVIKNVSQSTDNQSINVIPMPIPMDSGGGQQQVNVSSGSIAKGPGVSIPSSNPDNPYILGALAQYNVLA